MVECPSASSSSKIKPNKVKTQQLDQTSVKGKENERPDHRSLLREEQKAGISKVKMKWSE